MTKLINAGKKGFRVRVITKGEIAKIGHKYKDKDTLLLLLPVAGGEGDRK